MAASAGLIANSSHCAERYMGDLRTIPVQMMDMECVLEDRGDWKRQDLDQTDDNGDFGKIT